MPRKTYGQTQKPQDHLIQVRLREQARRLLSPRAIAGLLTEVLYVAVISVGALVVMTVIYWLLG